MIYDFDTVADRVSTHAEKWKGIPVGAISMSIADMDFKPMPEIGEAVKAAADKGEYGYVCLTEEDHKAVSDWVYYQTGKRIPQEHFIATPGVLYTARTSLYALTKETDKVIIQTPLHTPSIASASMLGREALRNELIYKDGRYTIDFDDLEGLFKKGAKALMVCTPHNPTGRMWNEEELNNIAYLVNKYDAFVISDEIHKDILWHGRRHISPADIPSLADRTVAAFSTSKSFNMGGFHIGSAVIPNEDIRKKVVERFYAHGHSCNRPSVMCIAAQTAAYTKGREWFEQMKTYVEKNFLLALEMLSDLPVKASFPEGTFLLWADITELKWNADKLKDVMYKEWKVIGDPGSYYDTTAYASYKGLEHHIRFNLATPRSQVEEAMTRIRRYFGK